jgi:hypothetical protein
MTRMTDEIQAEAAAAIRELDKGNSGEGLTTGTDFTGLVYVSLESEATWFQVEDDKYHVTNWISLDFPEFAAPGETLVVAADEHDMRNFEANRQPPATYSVGASDIEGLEPDEALYTGLTRDVALATLAGVIDLGEPEKYNYWMKREK